MYIIPFKQTFYHRAKGMLTYGECVYFSVCVFACVQLCVGVEEKKKKKRREGKDVGEGWEATLLFLVL